MNLNELIELAQKYDGTVSFDTETVANKMVTSVSYKDADDKVVTVTRTLNLDGTSDLDQSDFDTEHEGEEIKTVDPVLAYVEEQLVAHNAKLNHEVKFDPKEEQHGHLGGAIEMAKDFYKYEPNEIRVFSTTNGLFVTDIDGNNIDKPRVLATDEAYDEVEGLDLDFEAINDDTFKEMDDEGDLVHYPSSFEEFLAFFALDKQEDDAMNTKNMRDALRQMYGGEAKVGDFLVLARSTAYEYTTVPTTILNPALDLFIKGLDSLFYSNGDFGSVAKARIEYSTGGEDDLDFMSLLRNMDLASKVMNPYRELLDNLLFLSMGNAFGKEGVLTFITAMGGTEWDRLMEEVGEEEALERFFVNAIRETSSDLASLYTSYLFIEAQNYGEDIGYELDDLQDYLTHNVRTLLLVIGQSIVSTLVKTGMTEDSYLTEAIFERALNESSKDHDEFEEKNPDINQYVADVIEEKEDEDEDTSRALAKAIATAIMEDDDTDEEEEQELLDGLDEALSALSEMISAMVEEEEGEKKTSEEAVERAELVKASLESDREAYQKENKAVIDLFTEYSDELDDTDLPDSSTVDVSFVPEGQLANCVEAVADGIGWIERSRFDMLDNDIITGLFLNNLVNLNGAMSWLVNMCTVREQLSESHMRLNDFLEVTFETAKQMYANVLPSLLNCRYKPVVKHMESYMDVLEKNMNNVSLKPANDSSEEAHQLFLLSSALTAKNSLDFATRILTASGDYTEPKENVVAVEFTQQPTKETAEEVREKAIVKAYKENETLDVIKTCYNLDSNGALYSILRKHHVEPRDKKQATRGVAKRVAHITSDPDKMSAVLKAYRDGVTLTEIYKKFELHKNGLYYLLDLNNVPRRMKR